MLRPRLLWLRPAALVVALVGFAAGTVAATLVVGLPAPAVEVAPPAEGPRLAREGDAVRFHTYIYDESDALLFTSDLERARVEVSAGNPWLPTPNESSYRIGKGIISFAADERGEDRRITLSPSRLLVGHGVGDVIRTPLIVNPFGDAPTAVIPRTFGPLPRDVVLDLADAYSAANATNTTEDWGPRDALTVGSAILVEDVLEARIVSIEGDRATARVDLAEGDILASPQLGFNLSVAESGPDAVTLTSLLRPGDEFFASPCRLPEGFLDKGPYIVLEEREDGFLVERNPEGRAHLYGKTLRFEFHLLEVYDPDTEGPAPAQPEEVHA